MTEHNRKEPRKTMRKIARPRLAINMAMSADGKISSYRRESFPLGSRYDKKLMNELRARADAVIIGSGTLKVDGFPLLVRNAELLEQRKRKGVPLQPLNVLISSTLKIPLNKKFFHHTGTKKIVFTGSSADKELVRKAAKLAEVVVLPTKAISPASVIDNLARRGIRRILLEGGGEVNFSFLKAALVDELFITVTPCIVGGAYAPTVVDGKGFLRDALVSLELISAKRIENEVFLRYRVLS
jgi:riboflavin-specific deaminase-like protein